MAADLDQRSPDANQWGVGASNSVVGVRGRDGSSGRGCSRTNRGAVGASGTAGGAGCDGGSTGNAGSGCWPNRGRRRGMAGAEVWGPATASGAEGSEMVMNSSNWGVAADHEPERPAPRERSRVRGRSAVSAERSRVRGRSAAAAGGSIGAGVRGYCCSPAREGVAGRRREGGEVSASNNNTSSSKGKAPTRSSRRDGAGKFMAEQGRRHEGPTKDDGRGSDLSNRESSSSRTRSRGVGDGAGSGHGPAGIGDVTAAAAAGGGSGGADIMDTDSVYDEHRGYDHERIDGAGAGQDTAVSSGCGQSAASAAGAGLGDVSDADAVVSDMDAATGGHGVVPEGSEDIGGGSGGGSDFVARAASERLAFKLSVNLIDTYKLINQRCVFVFVFVILFCACSLPCFFADFGECWKPATFG